MQNIKYFIPVSDKIEVVAKELHDINKSYVYALSYARLKSGFLDVWHTLFYCQTKIFESDNHSELTAFMKGLIVAYRHKESTKGENI